MKMFLPRRRRIAMKRSRGLATLEMALFLPFLCFLLMVIFSVASISLSWMSATAEVRLQAWRGRYAPWKKDADYRQQTLSLPNARNVGKMLGPHPLLPPDGGLVIAETSRKIPLFYEGFKGKLGDAKAGCALLGGVWDFHEMPFENDRHRHPPLVPTPKWKYLAIPQIPDLKHFGVLDEF
jgi:hypothetical protein